jgi:hypothetical protein
VRYFDNPMQLPAFNWMANLIDRAPSPGAAREYHKIAADHDRYAFEVYPTQADGIWSFH